MDELEYYKRRVKELETQLSEAKIELHLSKQEIVKLKALSPGKKLKLKPVQDNAPIKYELPKLKKEKELEDRLEHTLKQIIGVENYEKYIDSIDDLIKSIGGMENIHDWFYEGQPELKGGFTREEVPFNYNIAKSNILEYLEKGV